MAVEKFAGKSRLNGTIQKSNDVRCARFGPVSRRQGAHSRPAACNRRATPRPTKFSAAQKTAVYDVVVRAFPVHCGLSASPVSRPAGESPASNVIEIVNQCTLLDHALN